MESFIHNGNQSLTNRPLVYGVSVTDACIGWHLSKIYYSICIIKLDEWINRTFIRCLFRIENRQVLQFTTYMSVQCVLAT